jgi:hypothetical protein
MIKDVVFEGRIIPAWMLLESPPPEIFFRMERLR